MAILSLSYQVAINRKGVNNTFVATNHKGVNNRQITLVFFLVYPLEHCKISPCFNNQIPA